MKAIWTVMLSVLVPGMLMLLPVTAGSLETGKKPSEIKLDGKAGGRLDGTAWSSTELKDKIFVMFYVDPDEKDLNEHVAEAIRKEQFPGDKFGSVAVINMGASWLPNAILDKVLAGKQKKFPRTIYVRDRAKLLVKEWGMTDDNYQISVFDRDGAVLFTKAGKFSPDETQKLVEMLKDKVQATP